MERLGDAARRLLQRLEARKAMEKVSGDRNGPNEFELEREQRGGRAQRSSNRAGGDTRGLERDAGEFLGSEPMDHATMRSPAADADTYRYDFTNAGPFVRFAGPVTRAGMKCAKPLAHRPGSLGISPRRLGFLADNDDVRGHCTNLDIRM